MTRSPTDELIARNPSTGAELARIACTPPDEIAGRVDRARDVQADWASRPWPERRSRLKRWHRVIKARSEELATTVRDEVGKPAGEAMAAEVVPSLDALRWTIRTASRVLRPRVESPRWQRWLLMPPAFIEHRPLGVVGVTGAWNYPVLLNIPVLAHAVAAGNAVVWKPSELSSRCGALIQETIDESGFPEGLLSLVQGGPPVGQALVEAGVDKFVFTGGVENGRRVLERLGARGTPAVAELSGFDAAVVLPDAHDDRTRAALRWSSFLGAGQACMSVKRIFIVGRDARPWAMEFARMAEELRIGDPSGPDVDLGPMISEAARDRFHATIQTATAAGAEVLSGAEPVAGPGWFYRPTVLLATPGDDAPERALEGCFGPVALIREVQDVEEAISAVNASRFGLSASVWGRDLPAARSLAERLEVGVVGINEATTFFAHASAPAGGVKASGFGCVHGAEGLLQLTAHRTIVTRSSRALRPQVFPYSGRLERLLRIYQGLFHR